MTGIAVMRPTMTIRDDGAADIPARSTPAVTAGSGHGADDIDGGSYPTCSLRSGAAARVASLK